MTDVSQCRILIVEDEPLLAMDAEMLLGDVGFTVLGPALNTAHALRLIEDEKPDLTILDLNLGAEMAFPVIERLAGNGMLFIIVSGHSREAMPAQHQGCPYLSKPYESAELLRLVHHVLHENQCLSMLKRA
jgi:DNA-binding response OmpR family regulator